MAQERDGRQGESYEKALMIGNGLHLGFRVWGFRVQGFRGSGSV